MIRIEKIIPGGQGLGTLEDGRKIFLWNTLPGELISDYKITKKKSHYLEGVATQIEEKSQYRVEPKDECYLSTSPWQIMDFDYELRLKKELIQECFRQNQIEISEPNILTDNREYFYRNKMEYALYWDNDSNKIQLAFHERGSHRKIPILQSSIERPEIFQRATEIIEELNSKGEEARKYQSLLLRCNQPGEASGGLYENGQPHPIFSNLIDSILGIPYSYSPNGFFQVNLPVYEMALKEIKKYIKTDKVLDLYAGVGSIGLSVARDKELTLVENNKYAYKELAENITSGFSNILSEENPLAILSNSEDVLDYIEREQTVIVDPPRAGCDKKLLERFLEVKPRQIIYLSCNPITQARDIKILQSKYIISDIKTFNFFPKTPHTENLVVLNISQNE